jgi:hypothetical protein
MQRFPVVELGAASRGPTPVGLCDFAPKEGADPLAAPNSSIRGATRDAARRVPRTTPARVVLARISRGKLSR